MSFQQLHYAGQLISKDLHFNSLIREWKSKRDQLSLYTIDLPNLVVDYKNAIRKPYELNSKITLIDSAPSLRLSSACEASTNCLYGMAEIAAQYANKIAPQFFPSSFNAITKKIEAGKLNTTDLNSWMDDYSWYRKVREIRTEWTHYSTIFIAEQDSEPITCVKSNRRATDRKEFPGDIQIQIPELIRWIREAIASIDNFGNYLLMHHLIPALDLDATFNHAKYDENGFPIITDQLRFEVEQITIREYLARGGITV